MYNKGIVFLKNIFKYLIINLEIFFFLLYMNYNCFDIISKLVLYDIIEDKKRIFWFLYFFNFFKFKILSKLLDLCVDDNEYIFFYRLVIGGNYLVF